ncbi:MAG: prolipoprotein diacylglyceryl transferase [Desulfobacteraceae bacterium]
MELIVFIFITGIISFALMYAGFKFLPLEKWQMMGAYPLKKEADGNWSARPLTFYGFISGFAYMVGVFIYLLLSLSILNDYKSVFIAGVPVLFACIPASRLIARIVENKKHTFTIGGASFFGFIIAPFWFLMAEKLIFHNLDFPVIPLMCAMIIAYAFGEGLGRLACISFGCCYGKKIEETNKFLRPLFEKLNFIFTGNTKKASYESDLENCSLVPIQGITSVLYVFTALFSVYLFFMGYFKTGFILSLVITQLWRAFSETLRFDFRGGYTILSAYQIFALISVFYGIILTFILPDKTPVPDFTKGISMVWNPSVIIFLEAVFMFTFWYMGRSEVTGAEIRFYVKKENI